MSKSPRTTRLSVIEPPATTAIEPPRKLKEAGCALWYSIQSEFKIEDSGGIEVLVQCCEAADRLETLAAQIDKDGEVVCTKQGPREHPLLKSELANRSFIVKSLRTLGVLEEAIRSIGRPPKSYGWTGHAD